MKTVLSEDQVMARLKRAIKEAGSLRALAREWGISPSYLCQVTRYRSPIGHTILGRLGVEKVITYREARP